MSTSSSIINASTRRIAVESAVAGAIASALALLIGTTDPWLSSTAAHPAWIAILAMSAFYGIRGLVIAGPIAAALVLVAAFATGADVVGLSDRIAGGQDLWMAMACLLIAGITMVHSRRREQLETGMAQLEDRTRGDDQLLEALRERVVELKGRAERVDVAIPVWRDMAERMASGDETTAASAALDLCLRRTGARAGIIRRVDGSAMHNLAWRGRWSRDRQIPRDIFPDQTIAYAIEQRKGVLATQVAGATAEDSDLAVPLVSSDGWVIGVLALRGTSRSQLGSAQLLDVASLARWLTEALTREASSAKTAIQSPGGEPAMASAQRRHLFVVEDAP